MSQNEIAESIDDFPIVCEWAWYEGKEYFAILNWEKTKEAGCQMIDLHHCVTTAFNGLVLMTVPYSDEKFQVR